MSGNPHAAQVLIRCCRLLSTPFHPLYSSPPPRLSQHAGQRAGIGLNGLDLAALIAGNREVPSGPDSVALECPGSMEGGLTVDAIHFLKTEHGQAKAAFAKIEQASAHHRAALWKELKPELTVHERMEDRCLYGPLAHDARDRDDILAQWPQRHAAEVKQVDALIGEIEALDARDSQWLTKVSQVRHLLEAHILKEEGEIFPRVGLVWNRERLEQAGSELERMKAEESRRAA